MSPSHPVQTSSGSRPSTAREDVASSHGRPETPTPGNVAEANGPNSGKPSESAFQRFVLTDPVAFRYLEEDSSTTVLDQRRELHGYECWVVEQWTTSRVHPTFVITTYTGDPANVVIVGVLSVPTDESTWSPRLRVYFKALNQYHARRKETPLGILMVTNLSGFPSSLTLIAVPDGDLRKHRFNFFVNENLKRFGCSGRIGMTLVPPSPATVAKFHQLYRVSDKNDIYKSVVELVKLCQSALMLFEQLPVDYADGLLCDVTERALTDWWREVGTEHYNIEPHDGILGPTTVAGLLGLLLGARNRLHSINAPVPKDPFDIEAMKQGIGAFQKQQRLTRSRRLDRRTLDRLHKASQKAADKEHWLVPKAVKSTVAELSGKGGEMVMDVVGRKDKAGIAEIESVDIERFAQLAYGDRCKWLWYGKPLKKSKGDLFSSLSNDVHATLHRNHETTRKSEERSGHTRQAPSQSEINQTVPEAHAYQHDHDAEESDDTHNKSRMLKRATNLKNDAKSGISKVKDAVGFRGHKAKPSIDEQQVTSPEQNREAKRPLLQRAHTSPYNSPSGTQSRDLDSLDDRAAAVQSSRLNIALGRQSADIPRRGSAPGVERSSRLSSEIPRPVGGAHAQPRRSLHDNDPRARSGERQQHSRQPSESKTVETAIREPTSDNVDSDSSQPNNQPTQITGSMLLRRAASWEAGAGKSQKADEAFPRHLSFSLAEDSVWNYDLSSDDEPGSHQDLRVQLAEQEFVANEAKSLHVYVNTLNSRHANWTKRQLGGLETLLQHADDYQQALDSMHFPHLESVQALQRQSETLLMEEQAVLEEGSKGIETLVAKLDYEIDGLKAKVEDVEAALGDFERGVNQVEERVAELEAAGERGSDWGCVVS